MVYRKFWARKYDKCQNCGTTRYRHVGKGLCSRCYRLSKRLEQVNGWNPDNPESLKGYPYTSYDPEEFRRIKSGFVTQIEERLALLKSREELLEGLVEGTDIEYQLGRIARRCRVRNKDMFFGIATCIDHSFDNEQKRMLFSLLNKIDEGIPWEGLSLIKVFLERSYY